jgi:hypothetical protein
MPGIDADSMERLVQQKQALVVKPGSQCLLVSKHTDPEVLEAAAELHKCTVAEQLRSPPDLARCINILSGGYEHHLTSFDSRNRKFVFCEDGGSTNVCPLMPTSHNLNSRSEELCLNSHREVYLASNNFEFIQVVLKMVLPRIVLPHFIAIAEAEAKAKLDKRPRKAKKRKPTKRETGELWQHRSQRLGEIPPGLLVSCQTATSRRHNSGPQFTVFSLPGGDLERQRWVRAEEDGMFSAEVDFLELWELFHPRGTIIHVHRFFSAI